MEDKIKNSEVWMELSYNPKFKDEFEKCLKKFSYYSDPKDLNIRVSDNKIIINYNSKIRNCDLGCQYKLFEQIEFFCDADDNLIINSLAGRFESEKGFKFKTTDGGYINTHYTCHIFDPDGVELCKSRYDDKYSFDKIEVNSFMNDFQSVILGAYNPDLPTYQPYQYPNVVGKGSQFSRKIRDIDNLGMVEVTKISSNKDSNNYSKEYYFNIILTNDDLYTPELIHIIDDKPFAHDVNGKIEINEHFRDMGITEDNYEKVARERFLSELNNLKNEKELFYADKIFKKYEMLIDKMKKRKEKVKRRTP